MNAEEVLEAIRAAGGEVTIVDGAAHVRAPRELSAELVAEARRLKSELMLLVSGATRPSQPPTDLTLREATAEAESLRAAWRGALLELGELAGWPRLPFKQGHAVAPGAIPWRQFTVRASVEDMRLALAALRVTIAALPRPEPDPQ